MGIAEVMYREVYDVIYTMRRAMHVYPNGGLCFQSPEWLIYTQFQNISFLSEGAVNFVRTCIMYIT